MDRKQDLVWLVPFALFGIAVSLVPLLGYKVNAGRHDQWVFLLLLGGWLASIVFVIWSVTLAFALKRNTRALRYIMLLLACVFVGLAVIGYGGLEDGFWELVAG